MQADPKLNNWFVPGISFSVEGQNLSTAGLYEMSFGEQALGASIFGPKI